jgi:hypothetical protein
MSQVLEHALDPSDWISRAARLLSPGGVLAIALPNFVGVYRLLGVKDPFLCPPIHLNHFTPASMRLLLERSGLRVVRVCSESRVDPGSAQLARSLWNVLSRPLAVTARGVMLWAIATKPE